MLTLEIVILDQMQLEFGDAFEYLFSRGFKRLDRSHKIKLAAIKYCKAFLNDVEHYDGKPTE